MSDCQSCQAGRCDDCPGRDCDCFARQCAAAARLDLFMFPADYDYERVSIPYKYSPQMLTLMKAGHEYTPVWFLRPQTGTR